MGAYSKDLRLKVLEAADRGMPRKEVVGTFGISLATLKRWLKKSREGEDLSPRFSTGARGASWPPERSAVPCGSSSERTTPQPSSATVSCGKSVVG